MGRKGVSKRKPSQPKSRPLPSNGTSGSVSSVLQTAEKQPVKTFDTSKDGASTRGGVKPSSDHKKSSKKS
jgi:hypothetical protein